MYAITDLFWHFDKYINIRILNSPHRTMGLLNMVSQLKNIKYSNQLINSR